MRYNIQFKTKGQRLKAKNTLVDNDIYFEESGELSLWINEHTNKKWVFTEDGDTVKNTKLGWTYYLTNL
jgi:hypothetical protein